MSIELLRRVSDLEKQSAVDKTREATLVKAVESLLAAVDELTAKVEAIEQKRGPGRPPNPR